jgi:hypothetical protein
MDGDDWSTEDLQIEIELWKYTISITETLKLDQINRIESTQFD